MPFKIDRQEKVGQDIDDDIDIIITGLKNKDGGQQDKNIEDTF